MSRHPSQEGIQGEGYPPRQGDVHEAGQGVGQGPRKGHVAKSGEGRVFLKFMSTYNFK
jgi:hypothetical protein